MHLWFPRVEQAAIKLMEGWLPDKVILHEVCTVQNETLYALVNPEKKKAAIIGHPLWVRTTSALNESQAEARFLLKSDFNIDADEDIQFTNLFEIEKSPVHVAKHLVG